MLLSRDGTFRVNLRGECRSLRIIEISFQITYNFAVQEVFADHHRIHGRRVFERQEGETPRTTSGVAHDGAGFHLAELRKVLSEVL